MTANRRYRGKLIRFKWVGTWSPREKKLRLFRIMWETFPNGRDPIGHTLNISITHWLPRAAHHSSGGYCV